MNSFLQRIRLHHEHWTRYLALALVTVAAILVSPDGLKAMNAPEGIILYAFTTMLFCLPIFWELFWGADADPKRRLGVMGSAFFLLLNLAIGTNRTPDVNRLSTILLQAVCLGLAIQCGTLAGDQQKKASQAAGAEE